jgi:hypothetical protein
VRLFNSKKKALVAAGISIVAVAGIATGAVAFWTTGGSGSGSATTGTPSSNLTINADGPTGLVPDGVAQDLTLHVTNPNGYSVDLFGDTVSITSGSIKCGTTTVDDSWFTLDANSVTSHTTIAANDSGDVTPSGVTLKMNDDVTHDQDVCQGATVSFSLTVASETGN